MALGTVGLKTAIWNNNLRSFALLAVYPFILGGMVWCVAALYGWSLSYSAGGEVLPQNIIGTANAAIAAWWPAVLGATLVWFVIAGFFHTRMIRALSHAKPVTREQEPDLYNLLENLCIARGLTVPRLQVIETDALNAFASGIDKKSYAITVTRGLMNRLQKDELEAVLGHELTHITNHDVRLLIISVIFAGMVGFLCQMVWSALRHGLIYSGRGRDKRDGRVMIFMLAVGVILWIGYLATMFTRFALSRRREFMADAGAVELTHNPEAMMRALMRISGHDRIPGASADIALMCIENSQPFLGLFATHPPIERRIQALAEATQTTVPALDSVDGSAGRNPWL